MASDDASHSVPKNPVVEQYMKNKPHAQQQPARQRADINHSIFADLEKEQDRENPKRKHQRNREHMNYVLDPDPAGRMLWERNRVIEQIRRRGRLTKAQLLKRTERESLSRSAWIKTSVKKLGALARQIAGKPIEDAIAQMRFSPKMAAKEVKKHLEHARDTAIVERGMGLGGAEGAKGDPVEIQLKDGKRKRIADRTAIYIDQAWVGRGQYGFGYDYRARGRLNTLRLPWTSKHPAYIGRSFCRLTAFRRHLCTVEGGENKDPSS